jgi:hypothetical protein
MNDDAAQDRREDMRTNCSCLVMIDPYEHLCPRCRIIRREREAERAELERELYSGEG